MSDRTVLHVLPHPGGGGDTYVDVLEDIPGYRLSRIYVAQAAASTPTAVAAGIARALRQAWTHDLLHAHGEVAAALLLPVLAARPSVVTLHGLHLARRLEGLGSLAASLNLRAILRAAQTICVSHAEHAELTALAGRSAARRAVVIHNGVRVAEAAGSARSEVRNELGIEAAEPVAIWVGSLDERRDPVAAVRAANEAGVTLLVVGDGSLRQEVERTAGPRVHLVGHRPDVERLLTAADFYVLVSRREGFAFGLLEAMARGLPAVVTDLPENVEAIGNTGIAVPFGDDQLLTSAIRRLAGDAAERAERGESARRRVVERFDARRMVARTSALYDDVLGERQPRTRPFPTAQ